MFRRSIICVLALAAVTVDAAQAQDKKYPDWRGEWNAVVPRTPGQQLRFDPTKPYGRRQDAPLTEEYRKIYQENFEEQARGGQGLFLDHAACLPAGMPTMMSIGRFEYIITPETTYVATGSDLRRIFTDGRPWPTDLEPTYQGFSTGKWIDEDGSGTYDVLEIETRGPFKGPRVYDFDRHSARFRQRVRRSRNASFSTRKTRTFSTTSSACSTTR